MILETGVGSAFARAAVMHISDSVFVFIIAVLAVPVAGVFGAPFESEAFIVVRSL